MIDGTGAKVLQYRRAQRSQNEREARCGLIGEIAREPREAGKKDEKECSRPENSGEELRPNGGQHGLGCPNEQRKRQVDETRPVHHHAVRRVESILSEIEPGLAGQKITHLHKAHCIVGGQRVIAPPSSDQMCGGDRTPNDDEDRASVDTWP